MLPDGRPRRDVGTLFTDVRCFYLDLAQWAAENPKVWKGCALPSPISEADMRPFSKSKHKRRAEMHARVRALAPLLPKLVSAVRKRHREARGLLEAALACNEGDTFSYGGVHYLRVIPDRSKSRRKFGNLAVRAHPLDDPEAEVINCRTNEEDAFWAWAVVEVLRLTGIRLEELLELTHLSVRQHEMQDGQKVLLLQIAPSKTDRERVLPVCPELAHALAAIVSRIKGDSSRIPTIVRYDTHERDFSAQLPYLFQRRRGGQLILISGGGARALLTRASKLADLQDVDGEPIRLTPHDFRRLFATEAVNGGLPIHIAAKLLGHLDVNTTRGYTAIYPEEVVRHFQAHVARRRVLRPTEEYREPTEQEWTEFATHFRRRRMALGDCYRPYGTDCPHEHAYVRCPMLRMDPAQKPRLLQIEDNTHELLAEAHENNWEGEVKGLEVTLVHIGEKKAQVDGILAARNEAADHP